MEVSISADMILNVGHTIIMNEDHGNRKYIKWVGLITLMKNSLVRALVGKERLCILTCSLMALRQAHSKVLVKPPNIFIICDGSTDSKSNASYHRTNPDLSTCVGQDRYVIYPLLLKDIVSLPWQENCQLLIVPAYPKVSKIVQSVAEKIAWFVNNGGRCLSFNQQLSRILLTNTWTESDALVAPPPELRTVVPVARANKLEDFVAVSRISNDVIHSVGSQTNLLMTPLAQYHSTEALPATVSLCVQLYSDQEKGIKFVTSSVDFLSPSFENMDVAMVTEIKRSAQARQDFLKSVLNQLDIDCTSTNSSFPSLSYSFLYTQTETLKDDFMKAISSVVPKLTSGVTITGSEVSIHVSNENYSDPESTPVDLPPSPSTSLLSILTNPSPWQKEEMDFDMLVYFSFLQTEKMGQVVVYTPVIPSTQTVFTGNNTFTSSFSFNGRLICVAGQQTRGKGRGGNLWLSPKGCMMFSLPLHFPSSTRLSQQTSILQHIVALAIVSAIRTHPGYEELEVFIKWPNDIYYKKKVKLGGILVTAYTMGADTTAIIGCGVNVDNRYPTMSLNDCIFLHNQERDAELETLSVEKLLSLTLNKLEMLLKLYQEWGLSAVEDLYYQYWMHGGSSMQLSSSPNKETVTITGIDKFGFLRVVNENGEPLTLHPDGNTLDIMKGLIAAK